MPFFRTDGVVLGTLLLCVPLQYLLVRYWGHTETSRTHELNQFIKGLTKFRSKYLEWESWRTWVCRTFFDQTEEVTFVEKVTSDFDNPHGESPAAEVMKYKQSLGQFGLSAEPRIRRSPYIKFRVGQVVVHKYWKYRGVIIGWDEYAKAPDEWLKNMHGQNTVWRTMPNYAILVDVRDRLTPQLTYVPEDNIEAVTNTKVLNPAVDEFFESFDGVQYIPRPSLRAIYPVD